MDLLAEMNQKKKVLKERLDCATSMNAQINEELFLVKSHNFEINQRSLKIVKEKDTPYVDYVSQVMDMKLNGVLPTISKLMDAKLNPILAKLTELANARSSGAPLQ